MAVYAMSADLSVVKVAPKNLDAKLRLANLLEETGHKVEALEIVTEGR